MANIFEISDKTINQAIGDIDLSPAMIYLFDVVNVNAFSFLATQFDVEGFKGWDLAVSDVQKRELLKTSIQIKRHLGTPYAIKQALSSIGFDKVTIKEGVSGANDLFFSGVKNYDGSIMFGGSNWSAFTVTVISKYSVAISSETKALIEKLILYYKNARSKLIEVVYQQDSVYYFDGTLVYNSIINYQ